MYNKIYEGSLSLVMKKTRWYLKFRTCVHASLWAEEAKLPLKDVSFSSVQ